MHRVADYSMAFHLDCKGRHGLTSIECKPASYRSTEWRCDACKRRIPDNLIGVLNCTFCHCDICPDCWTVLLPRIVNAAGYPCFWRDLRPASFHAPARILGCHRRQTANQLCGIDPVGFGCCSLAQPQPAIQCNECRIKQQELNAAPAPMVGQPARPVIAAAPPSFLAGPFLSPSSSSSNPPIPPNIFGRGSPCNFGGAPGGLSSAGIPLSFGGSVSAPAPASTSESSGTTAATPVFDWHPSGLGSIGAPDVPGPGCP
jgi:hypothetical protein